MTTIRVNKIHTDTRELAVSTAKIAPRHYETVVFDDSANKRHANKAVGDYVIGYTADRSSTRAEALDIHRAAFLTARDGDIRETPQD